MSGPFKAGDEVYIDSLRDEHAVTAHNAKVILSMEGDQS